MTTYFISPMQSWRDAARAAFAGFLIVFCAAASAGPGTHGPGGEHLDAPGAQGAGGAASPRVESKSELFELVAHLGGGELSTLINRFETNEPVLNASVEVATGTLKAAAKFHADHGDYAVDDAAFLKALSAPGDHGLIFTIVSGTDSDLLEGTLTVTAADANEHDHSHRRKYAVIAAGVAGAIALAFVLWRRRSRNRRAFASARGLS